MALILKQTLELIQELHESTFEQLQILLVN